MLITFQLDIFVLISKRQICIVFPTSCLTNIFSWNCTWHCVWNLFYTSDEAVYLALLGFQARVSFLLWADEIRLAFDWSCLEGRKPSDVVQWEAWTKLGERLADWKGVLIIITTERYLAALPVCLEVTLLTFPKQLFQWEGSFCLPCTQVYGPWCSAGDGGERGRAREGEREREVIMLSCKKKMCPH